MSRYFLIVSFKGGPSKGRLGTHVIYHLAIALFYTGCRFHDWARLTLDRLVREPGKVGAGHCDAGAGGLAAMHKKGLVHRDIKPTNIMVSFEEGGGPAAKIIDLGLAKAVAGSNSDATISLPGAFAGTPEFASPEQFTGAGVDIRSDLYSLGVTLWEMLTGRAPFRGSLAEAMYQHQSASLPVEQLRDIPSRSSFSLKCSLRKTRRNASRVQLNS